MAFFVISTDSFSRPLRIITSFNLCKGIFYFDPFIQPAGNRLPGQGSLFSETGEASMEME